MTDRAIYKYPLTDPVTICDVRVQVPGKLITHTRPCGGAAVEPHRCALHAQEATR